MRRPTTAATTAVTTAMPPAPPASSQTPLPNAPPAKRRPRKISRPAHDASVPLSHGSEAPPVVAARTQSTDSAGGGVRLPDDMIPHSGGDDARNWDVAQTQGQTQTQAQSRRRRPRKLGPGAEGPSPLSTTAAAVGREGKAGASAGAGTGTALPAKVSTEISALNRRVNEIEGRVQRLMAAPVVVGKAARRRGGGVRREREEEAGGGGKDAVTGREQVKEQEDDDEDEKTLVRQNSSRTSQSAITTRPRPTPIYHHHHHPPQEGEDTASAIEDIPRSSVPSVSPSASRPRHPARATTLSGAYRIPVPSSVSASDVAAVQAGLRSVGSVARRWAEERRGRSGDGAYVGDNADGGGQADDVHAAGRGGGWSSWLGGYSVSVTHFLNNIQVDGTVGPAAADEEEVEDGRGAKKPPRLARASTEPPRRPRKLRIGNGEASELLA